MFCDEVNITVSSGAGGDGFVSFRREKYVPLGAPDGGNGGDGGGIIVQVWPNQRTLSAFRSKSKYQASSGKGGGRKDLHGRAGEDLIIKVPIGTVVWDEASGEQLADLRQEDEKIVILEGGRGGYGNAHFVTSTRQAPRFAEIGEPGKTLELRLELKLVADVGIVGIPSAGKSTLISRVSNVKAKVGGYPFTTLVPNLGVVTIDDYSLTMCDLPGLIAGAAEGKGLGDKFLRHLSRVRCIVHLLDVTSDWVSDYKMINRELKKYSPELSKKSQLIVLNKLDTVGDPEDEIQKAKQKLGVEVIGVSSVSGYGLESFLRQVRVMVESEPEEEFITEKEEIEEVPVLRPHLDDEQAWSVYRKRGKYYVIGKRIEQLAVMTPGDNAEAMGRLFDVLRKWKIDKELRRAGADSESEVWIADKQFNFGEV